MLKEESEKYEENMNIKKNKFYAINTLFLSELSYIQNEYDLAIENRKFLPMKDIKEHLTNYKKYV